jgi:carboxypeptidase family protein
MIFPRLSVKISRFLHRPRTSARFLGVVSIVTLALGVLAYPQIGAAQGFYGSITGTVTDSTGAVVLGATVNLTNSATGVKTQTATNGDGVYSFPNIQPGTYQLTITQSGFKTTTRDSIDVQVASSVRVDIALAVGNATETAEVSAEAPILQTEEGSLGATIEGRAVTDMPLNGRNIYGLVGLVPGAVPQSGTSQGATGENIFAYGNFQIGGGGANESSSTLDGAPLNTIYLHGTALVPTQDAVAEFKVQTNNLGPEYGDFLGGVMNMVSKSGTDGFHGTAYEFIRNKVLNANGWFANHNSLPRVPFTQNEYGLTAGGPIVPKKTFFFFSWEGFGLRSGVTITGTQPNTAEMAGDFTALLPTPINDPTTGKQFMGCNGNQPNVICNNRLDKGALAIINSLYTIVPGPTIANNFAINSSSGGNYDEYNARVDQVISEKQRFFTRYTYWKNDTLPTDETGKDAYSNFPDDFTTTNIVLGDTYVLNPSTVADLRIAFLRYNYGRLPGPQSINYNLAQNYGWPTSTVKDISIPTKPLAIIGGDVWGNAAQFVQDVSDSFAIEPNMTKTIGKHTLNFGADLRKGTYNFVQAEFASGLFVWVGNFTGNPTADAVLGAPGGADQANEVTKVAATQNYQGYYLGDTWHVNPRLTLNLGVRWEIPGPWTERHDRITDFEPNVANPLASGYMGAVTYVNTAQRSQRGSTNSHYDLFAPRVGASYRLTNKTVVRAGFGLFYAPGDLAFSLEPNSDAVNNAQTTVNPAPGVAAGTYSMSNPFPDGINVPLGRSGNVALNQYDFGQSFGSPIPNETYPYVAQFNAAIEQQLGSKTSLQVAFAGSQGSHLNPPTGSGDAINPLPDKYLSMGSALLAPVVNPFYGIASNGPLAGATVPAGQLLRKYPEYYDITDAASWDRSSKYDSLQATFQHRFEKGGTALVAYTWGKILGNADNTTGYFLDSVGSNTDVAQDPNNLHAERALSYFDVRQRLVVSYVLDLPFGNGQRFLHDANGVTNALAGGWGVDGITTFQSGFPIPLIDQGATAISTYFGGGIPRPNYTAGCNKSTSGSRQSRALNGWYNISCFTAPAEFGYGNESRTDSSLMGDGVKNFDFAVFKTTHIAERFNVQFRTEIFNIFNRTQFAAPQGNLADGPGVAGIVTSQQNNPRLFQFALRLNY